jgi:hypothetical protein
MRIPTPLRLWMLLAAIVAWLWAGSVFTPWAGDRAPRLWLYDLLFYMRFVLLFWAGAEVLRMALARARPRLAEAVPLATAALVALVAFGYTFSEHGLRWKLATSHDALVAAARAGNSDQRRRVGHFLLDSVRVPCGDRAAWLWLGRPFGAGTGINLALVRADRRVPATPFPEAFAFWHAVDGWWLAYQHAGRYQRAMQRQQQARQPVAACSTGRVLSRHGQGQAFINAGRDALTGTSPVD